jgi:hypothetical protein
MYKKWEFQVPTRRLEEPSKLLSRFRKSLKKKKKLCYTKWHVGHKCPNPRLFVIESVEIWEEENIGQLVETVNQETNLMEFTYSDVNPEIS